MVRKKLALAVLALTALQAGMAGALGLGNLSIKSSLNQPLNAEIKLLDTGDLDPSQVKIQLAAPEDFQRAGVDRDFFLTNLRFSVDMDGRGGGTIRIRTNESVVEPYLNFVIEARWPNGRLLREFAVLLDPPTFSASKGGAQVAPAAASNAQSAKRGPQPPTVRTEPAAKTENAPAAAAPDAGMAMPAARSSGEYRIQAYDTLSKIASRNKPAADVSVAQTMIAIQRANPQVFINNNVNLIKSGYVLRLPTADEARAIAGAQAEQEVDEQTHAWRGGTTRPGGSVATATGPQLDASAPAPSSKESGAAPAARLSIASPGDSVAGSGGSGKDTAALRNQLTASQESLEKGKRDNKELQSRLDDMERQIATLQKLISLKDDQLAALQTRAGEKPAAVAAPVPAPSTPAAAVPAPAPESVAEAPATDVAPDAATPAPAVVVPPKPEPAPKQAVKPAPAPQSGLVDQLTANPVYLGGAVGAAVLALIALIVAKRRKAAAEAEDAELDELTFEGGDNFAFANADLDNSLVSDDAITPIGAEAEPEHQPEPVKNTVRSETGDAIAESDIYIAYGRYQQAVDLLSHAIDVEPTRSDLRVKLLEVYVEMRNREAFRQQFVALQSLGDSAAIAHVKDLLSSVDGVSDWLNDLPSGQSSSPTLAAAAAIAATGAAAWAADDVIDEPQPLEQDAELSVDDFAPEALEPAAPAVAPADEEGEFEFDLDLDSLEEPAAPTGAIADLDTHLGIDEPKPFAVATQDEALDLDLENELDLDEGLDLTDDLAAPVATSATLTDLTLDFDSSDSIASPAADLDLGLADFGADSTVIADELGALDESFEFDEEKGLDADFEPAAELNIPSFASTPAPAGSSLLEPGSELELDLGGDDDLDRALSELGATDELGDLEAMSAALNDLNAAPALDVTPAAQAPVSLEDFDTGLDLDTELGLDGELELPDEFDLSQASTSLPDIQRADQSDELDVFAGLNEPAAGFEPAPATPTPALEPVPEFNPAPEFNAAPEFNTESAAAALEEGDDFDFLADADEVATKLDLARAYIDMGDTDGAKDILDEVLQEGTDTQRQEASTLLSRIG